MMDTILVNGEEGISRASTIVDLLRAKGIEPDTRFLAVAINGAVVPRRDWEAARIGKGDNIDRGLPSAVPCCRT